MRSVYELQEVVGVALSRGVRNINLYSLEGAVNSVPGLDAWLKAAAESRPASGMVRWTPVGSVRMWLAAGMLNRLFDVLVVNP
jgi:hypothetical protein